MYPDDDVLYPIPDYRKEPDTCKWCGKPLKNKRQQSFCSKDCSFKFNNMTVWDRGVTPLAYRILCRDNFTCQECGEFLAYKNEYGMFIPVAVGLDVHHKQMVSQGGSDHQSNLTTLCCSCHKEQHSYAK